MNITSMANYLPYPRSYVSDPEDIFTHDLGPKVKHVAADMSASAPATIGPVGGGPRGTQKSEPKPGRVVATLPWTVLHGMGAALGQIAAGTIHATSPSSPLSQCTGAIGWGQFLVGVGQFLGADNTPEELMACGNILMGAGLVAAAAGLGYPAMIPIVGGAAINVIGTFSR